MKKIFSLLMVCFMALTLSAQRAAVLEFKAGSGISQADVDGISAIFITYFRPEGYTMVERIQIDRVIDEQGFQRGKLTEQQMVKIGQILNVSKVVVGDINVVMGQYNVDVRALNVQSGTIAATEGATFQSSSYRASMQSIATKLAGKIAIKAGSTVPATSTPAQPVSNGSEPTILYGYLKVFPNDLGTFDSRPATVIANLNKLQQYGYGTWRLPTNEELNLMIANNLITGDKYMTSDGKRSGVVRLVTDKQKGEVITIPAGYVDLGLHSGTLWKDKNEEGGLFTYNTAAEKFGTELPSKEQFEELKSSCKWVWSGNGYKVIGPSGEFIILPAEGSIRDSDPIYGVGSKGEYWSSTSDANSSCKYLLSFNSDNVVVGTGYFYSHIYRLSVRLVQ